MTRESFPISHVRCPVTAPLRASIGGRTSAHRQASGFTLIEILVVLGIITIVAALGVPVFNALSGNRSTEAGRNVVAAALGQARTLAINEGRYAGVLFYVDPATERTAMSIVSLNDPAASFEDDDPYDKYKAWIPGEEYYTSEVDQTASPPRVTRSDRVISIASDANATFKVEQYQKPPGQELTDYIYFFGNYRPIVQLYRCKERHTAADSTANRPPRNGPSIGGDPRFQVYPTATMLAAPTSESTYLNFSNQFWGTGVPLVSTDTQLLPRGVGVQVIVPPIAAGADAERYLRVACILFDSQGRLVTNRRLSISAKSTLGASLGLATDPAVVGPMRARGLSPDAEFIYSGLGVVIYDGQTFRSQNFSESDWVYQARDNNDSAIVSSETTVFGDYPRDNPSVVAAFNNGSPTNAISERAEETWLQNNSVPLLINRYSGSLTETE